MTTATSLVSTREETIRTYFAAADAGDIERALACFTPDVTIRFANAEPQVGTQVLLAVLAQLGAVVSGFRHDVRSVLVAADGERAGAELQMTYIRHDGSELYVPAGCFFEFADDGRINGYRSYIDLAELFGPAAT